MDIAYEAHDLELLLVSWINELVYRMAVSGRVFKRYQVLLDNGKLTAMAFGETLINKVASTYWRYCLTEKKETVITFLAASSPQKATIQGGCVDMYKCNAARYLAQFCMIFGHALNLHHIPLQFRRVADD
ncbi:MAG: archease [Methylobacter sp.]